MHPDMRIFILILIIYLGFTSCDKKPDDKNFCKSCDLKTDGIEIIKNRTGLIVFNSEYNKYMIQTASWEWSEFYVPCQVPSYFTPVEKTTVEFSGTVIEDTNIKTSNYPTYYHCIKLDTIYLRTTK
jgi:hypothetical protein